MFVRLSQYYQFIRETVCHHSVAPLDRFDCSSISPPPPPTPAPTIPPPSENSVVITIKFLVGFDPRSIRWSLETLDGTTVYSAGRNSYRTHYAAVLEHVTVRPNTAYNLVVRGGSGGLRDDTAMVVAAYYGILSTTAATDTDEARQLILAAAPYSRHIVTTLTTSPQSALPSLWLFGENIGGAGLLPQRGPLIAVSVLIFFDTYPTETRWTIEKAPVGQLVAEGGPYSPFIGDHVLETVHLEENADFFFNLYDSTGTGICCYYGHGEAFVYLDSLDQTLVHDDGRFTFESFHRFRTSRNSAFPATSSPTALATRSPAPTVMTAPSPTPLPLTVSAKIGAAYSGYLSWALLAIPSFEVVESSPRYGFNRQVFTNTTIELQQDNEYLLKVYNSFGDGLCCGDFVTVSLGDQLDHTKALAYVTDNFEFTASQRFVLSPQEAKQFTSSPTAVATSSPTYTATHSPRPSSVPSSAPSVAPTVSLYPTTQGKIPILMKVSLPSTPPARMAVAVYRDGNTQRLVYENQDLSFVEQGNGQADWSATINVDLGREYLLEITAVDGLCCFPGTISVHDGNDLSEQGVLLVLEGQRGFRRQALFVAPGAGLVDSLSPLPLPSSSPSLAPTKRPTARPTEVPVLVTPIPTISSLRTALPTTVGPASANPTTLAPVTSEPVTSVPVMEQVPTMFPVSATPVSPATIPPERIIGDLETVAPTTDAPTTPAPATPQPVTAQPVTGQPTDTTPTASPVGTIPQSNGPTSGATTSHNTAAAAPLWNAVTMTSFLLSAVLLIR